MNEKVKMLYAKHGKLYLNVEEMCSEINISKSTVSKLLSPKNGPGEKVILEQKILPVWRTICSTRMWSIEEIVRWSETELKTA